MSVEKPDHYMRQSEFLRMGSSCTECLCFPDSCKFPDIARLSRQLFTLLCTFGVWR